MCFLFCVIVRVYLVLKFLCCDGFITGQVRFNKGA